MDIERIKDSYDMDELLLLWRQGDEATRRAEGEDAESPEVAALQTLAANARLVELLTASRWESVQRAREEGATWQEVGDALGVTRQAAHELFARQIAAPPTQGMCRCGHGLVSHSGAGWSCTMCVVNGVLGCLTFVDSVALH